MRSVSVFVSLFAASASTAFGHPGHGTSDGTSVWHHVASPYHMGTTIAFLLVVSAAGQSIRVYRRKRATAVRQVSPVD